MKKVIFSYLVLCTLIAACTPSSAPVEDKRELFFDEGIYTEKYDSLTLAQNPDWFSEDNRIYTADKKYVYSCSFFDKTGTPLLLQALDDSYWVLANREDIQGKDTIVIDAIHLSTMTGRRPFIKMDPTYDQTVIKYEFFGSEKKIGYHEKTGVIENEKNVWLHPMRTDIFRIMELNPFPFIQKPYELGNTFKWDLNIGDQWSDSRWKVWSGMINNQYTYEITGEQDLLFASSKIPCFKVEAKAESRIGTTYLTSYFNEDYGFVRLDYTNIDSSKISLNLSRVEELTADEK